MPFFRQWWVNRKSIVGTVLAGGKKEILSLWSIDSSIPVLLTGGLGDRKSEKSSKDKEEASRRDEGWREELLETCQDLAEGGSWDLAASQVLDGWWGLWGMLLGLLPGATLGLTPWFAGRSNVFCQILKTVITSFSFKKLLKNLFNNGLCWIFLNNLKSTQVERNQIL